MLLKEKNMLQLRTQQAKTSKLITTTDFEKPPIYPEMRIKISHTVEMIAVIFSSVVLLDFMFSHLSLILGKHIDEKA